MSVGCANVVCWGPGEALAVQKAASPGLFGTAAPEGRGRQAFARLRGCLMKC